MIDSIWPSEEGSDGPLPEPTVAFPTSESSPDDWTESDLRAILTNPVYAGIGPYPPYISDAQWVACAKKLVAEEGPEQFLVNLLHVLRASFAGFEPKEQ